MNTKRLVAFFVVVIALVALVAWLSRGSGASAPVVETAAASQLPPASFTTETAQYQIAANYPTTTPLSGSANDSALAIMRNFIASSIASFAASASSSTPGNPYTLGIEYLISSSARTVSYIFTIDQYTGGAHDFGDFTTFTFDTTTGAPLALADLFTPGSDYLSVLSQNARAALPTIIGQDADIEMINQGTTPSANNFKEFFIDNNNLDILFPPYQVASYAAGPQTLPIPLASLASILKSEYR